jgi:hypothetical protein
MVGKQGWHGKCIARSWRTNIFDVGARIAAQRRLMQAQVALKIKRRFKDDSFEVAEHTFMNTHTTHDASSRA